MSDNATETTTSRSILGFDVKASIFLGADPSDKTELEISSSITNISYAFKNFTFLPMVMITFLVDAKYVALMTNPYELELSIVELSREDTPRTVITGKFFCFPKNAPVAYTRDANEDNVRFKVQEIFYPTDVSKTFAKETFVLATDSTVEDALNAAFKKSVSGTCKLKTGTFSNKTTYKQIVMPMGKLQAHIATLINYYGLTDLGLIAYCDFDNLYVHTANEVLAGDENTKDIDLTVFFGDEDTSDEESNTEVKDISTGNYYIRTPPKIRMITGLNQMKYSSDVNTIIFPRSGNYIEEKVNVKSQAGKMVDTKGSDTFNYYDLFKETETQMYAPNDDSFVLKSRITGSVTSSYEMILSLMEPFLFTDFPIGRTVKFDSSVSDYVGLLLTGYIDGVEFILNSNNNNRWIGVVNLYVKCTSNNEIQK